jgi:aspartate carbamoyltransferase regulatory subunit
MKELKVQFIKNGTVIDHISPGMALKVLKILRVDEKIGSTVSVLMHVPSKMSKWKDVVKIEDRELDPQEVDRIALIAPSATINIIRNFNVVEKHRVSLPDRVREIVRCTNPNCVTNTRGEPVTNEFLVESKDPLRLRCKYCERFVEDIAENIV